MQQVTQTSGRGGGPVWTLRARLGLRLVAALVSQRVEPADLAATITAALPTAQNVYVYAVRYTRRTALARDAVLLSTAACVPVLMGVATFAA